MLWLMDLLCGGYVGLPSVGAIRGGRTIEYFAARHKIEGSFLDFRYKGLSFMAEKKNIL